MQKRATLHIEQRPIRHVHLPRQFDGQLGDAFAVTFRRIILRIERRHEHLQRRVVGQLELVGAPTDLGEAQGLLDGTRRRRQQLLDHADLRRRVAAVRLPCPHDCQCTDDAVTDGHWNAKYVRHAGAFDVRAKELAEFAERLRRYDDGVRRRAAAEEPLFNAALVLDDGVGRSVVCRAQRQVAGLRVEQRDERVLCAGNPCQIAGDVRKDLMQLERRPHLPALRVEVQQTLVLPLEAAYPEAKRTLDQRKRQQRRERRDDDQAVLQIRRRSADGIAVAVDFDHEVAGRRIGREY